MKEKKLPPFIAFGGCEGSGKTTQFARLKEKFPHGVFFREPGGTDFSEKEMRRLILNSSNSGELTPFQHMCLFFCGREDNIRNIVVPALRAGKPVFADRFDCCSFAYQVFGMEGTHLHAHFDSNRLIMGPLWAQPTLYIILDVSPEVGMKRVAERQAAKGEVNHFDKRGPDFHARVREGYKRFAELHQNRCVIIDAERSKDEVWKSIEEAIRPYFS